MESFEGIGEENVGVSLVFAVHVKVKVGIGGHCLEVAVVVECWKEEEGEVEGDEKEEEEEEGFEEEVVVGYLVGVEESGGVGE